MIAWLCLLCLAAVGGDLLYTIAGTGTAGYSEVSSSANSAMLNNPMGVSSDGKGFYIADTGNHVIRYVSEKQIIRLVAGSAKMSGYNDSSGTSAALLSFPSDVSFYKESTTVSYVYIADTGNHRIRRLSTKTNLVITALGSGEDSTSNSKFSSTSQGFCASTQFNFSSPRGVAVAASGAIYVTDSSNYVYKFTNDTKNCQKEGYYVNIVIGAVTTSGERQGSSYMLFKPYGVAAYTGGAMVVGEYNNSVVKYTINGQTAQMTAGTGKKGNLPKGNASIDATSAQLNAPSGITVFNTSLSSIYYVSDTGNNRVCKVVNGQLSTVAGGGPLCSMSGNKSTEGTDATSACLHTPIGVEYSENIGLLIADSKNNRIVVLYAEAPTGQPTRQPSRQPTSQPSMQPSRQPTMQPSGQPSNQPSSQPTMQPSRKPSQQPTSQPTSQPSRMPTHHPVSLSTSQPTGQPTSRPTAEPTAVCPVCKILKSNFFDSQIDSRYVQVKVDFFLATYVAFFVILFIIMFLLDKSKIGSDLVNKLLTSACSENKYATFLPEASDKKSSSCDKLSLIKEYRTIQQQLSACCAQDTALVAVDTEDGDGKTKTQGQHINYPEDYLMYILSRRCYFGCKAIIVPNGLKIPCFRERATPGRFEDYLIHQANNHSVISCIFTIKGSKYSRTSRRVVFIMQHMCTFTLVAFTECILLLVKASPSAQPLFNILVISPLSLSLNVVFRKLFTHSYVKKTTATFLVLSIFSFLVGFVLLFIAALFSQGDRFSLISTYSLEVFVFTSVQELLLDALLYSNFFFALLVRKGQHGAHTVFTVGAYVLEEYLRIQPPAGMEYQAGHKEIFRTVIIEWASLVPATAGSRPQCDGQNHSHDNVRMSFTYSNSQDFSGDVVKMVENPLRVLQRERDSSLSQDSSIRRSAQSRGGSLGQSSVTKTTAAAAADDTDNNLHVETTDSSQSDAAQEEGDVEEASETVSGKFFSMFSLGKQSKESSNRQIHDSGSESVDSDVLRKFKGRRGSYFEKIIKFETNAITSRKEREKSIENTLYLAKSVNLGKNALLSTKSRRHGSGSSELEPQGRATHPPPPPSPQKRASIVEMISSAIKGYKSTDTVSQSASSSNRRRSVVQLIGDAMHSSSRKDTIINILASNEEDDMTL